MIPILSFNQPFGDSMYEHNYENFLTQLAELGVCLNNIDLISIRETPLSRLSFVIEDNNTGVVEIETIYGTLLKRIDEQG